MKAVRLNKFIADCTGISRRKADDLIQEGHIKINGKPAKIGQLIHPEKDRVFMDGERLVLQRKEYVLFYKPAGYITTRHDPEGRKTIYDLLPLKYLHLDPVGRLDRDSSGVLILSNDGDFIQKLSHPRFEHQKVYRVMVTKALTMALLQQLEKGISLQPENKIATAQVREVIGTHTVILILKTGMNRQIRRSFEALGYDVKSLKRIGFSGITLGQLKPGQTRPLKPFEIKRFLGR